MMLEFIFPLMARTEWFLTPVTLTDSRTTVYRHWHRRVKQPTITQPTSAQPVSLTTIFTPTFPKHFGLLSDVLLWVFY